MLNLFVIVDGCDELEIYWTVNQLSSRSLFKLYTYKLPSQFVQILNIYDSSYTRSTKFLYKTNITSDSESAPQTFHWNLHPTELRESRCSLCEASFTPMVRKTVQISRVTSGLQFLDVIAIITVPRKPAQGDQTFSPPARLMEGENNIKYYL